MDISRNMFFIVTNDSAVLLPSIERAGAYTQDMMLGMIEKGVPVSITIQTRSAEQVALFLHLSPAPVAPVGATGGLPSTGKVESAPPPIPAKKAAPAKAATAKAPKMPKDKTPLSSTPAIKPGINRSLVLAVINACTRETAIEAVKICKKTKLGMTSVSPMLSEFFKNKLIDRIEGYPLKFFKREESAQPTRTSHEIHCNARDRKIPADKCKFFLHASPVCHACVVRPKA